MTFAAYAAALAARLENPLPGTQAQFTMAPHYRRDASLASVQDKPCREAAVLALLFPLPDTQPGVLLTVRHGGLKQHAGQVSFPGGRREANESLWETAIREAEEEVRLPAEQVTRLGALTPLYVPPSGFCVYPFVGSIERLPPLRPDFNEVDTILQVPLATLRAPDTRVEEEWVLRGKTLSVPFFAVAGHKVWGATAMMLAELLAVCTEVALPKEPIDLNP